MVELCDRDTPVSRTSQPSKPICVMVLQYGVVANVILSSQTQTYIAHRQQLWNFGKCLLLYLAISCS